MKLNKNKNKNVYIVLTQNNTLLSKIIKRITKQKYSHASITFNQNCLKMYSFGRKYYNNPIYGIFKIENIKDRIFMGKKNNTIAIYKITVTNEEYQQIKKNIKYVNKTNNGYNILGLLLAIINKRPKRNKFYCSEFVYEALSRNTNVLTKKEDAIRPEDIIKLTSNITKVYEGKIRDFIKINNLIQA